MVKDASPSPATLGFSFHASSKKSMHGFSLDLHSTNYYLPILIYEIVFMIRVWLGPLAS
jgi:hypothetical protein